MKRFFLFLPFLAFAAIAIGFWVGLGPRDDTLPTTLAGKPLPQFEIAGLTQSQALSTAAIEGSDKVTLVNFFASWCAPCRAEHPLLMQLAERDDLRLIGIAYKNDADDAQGFLDQLGDPYALTGMDRNGRAAIDWGVYGVPETFVVSKDGKVIERIAEALVNTQGQAKLVAALKTAGIEL